MKNIKVVILIVIAVFFTTACRDEIPTGGSLTIIGHPSNVRGVVVYNDSYPTTLMQLNSAVSMSNAIAGSDDYSSPFKLTNKDNSPFRGSGTFFVVMLIGSSTIHYLPGVDFRNGFATIDFEEMFLATDLPLW